MASPLIKLHRLLITMAIGLGFLLLVYGVVQYLRAGDAASLATGIAGVLVCGGLIFYLRWFLQKQRASEPPSRDSPRGTAAP
jgi:hypothetical protein